MIATIEDKPTMVIAGPGAGKTHDMVNRIVEAIPDLRPNRVLAAITFTNAATDSIRERLQDYLVQIPPNVFVGTNYSFFNQFILLPFASLFDYVGLDKIFLEIEIRKIVDSICKNNRNFAFRNAVRKKVVNKFLREGKVPFEEIASVSAKLMETTQVCDVVCNRIQFLFKDEFQDTDTVQLKIFDAIRKGQKTVMYSVGDPEQYILGFTYDLRGTKKPSFKNIPINKFAIDCNERKIDTNRRACEQVVEFTNNFHTSIKQVSDKGPSEHGGVFFIEDTDLDTTILRFIELTQAVIDSCEDSKRLFLGYENKTFDGFVEKYGLVPISNEHRRPKSLLSESLELISSATLLTAKDIRDEYNLEVIAYRKLGIKLLKALISSDVRTKDELISFINDGLKLRCQEGTVNLDSKLDRLIHLLFQESIACSNNFYSSIHKAKGLEAECVLVVSKGINKLKKWLTTDYEERCKDKSDTCRIGYVGFTRSKEILCIACREQVDSPIKENLRELGVTILD
jgi:DNA helicase-2/ATP-dependent DNA helicase PcrA